MAWGNYPRNRVSGLLDLPTELKLEICIEIFFLSGGLMFGVHMESDGAGLLHWHRFHYRSIPYCEWPLKAQNVSANAFLKTHDQLIPKGLRNNRSTWPAQKKEN